eukprot:2409170-Pleurochrysis_carterae.AAC.1
MAAAASACPSPASTAPRRESKSLSIGALPCIRAQRAREEEKRLLRHRYDEDSMCALCVTVSTCAQSCTQMRASPFASAPLKINVA